MAELRTSVGLDAVTESQLRADLAASDPAMWPMVVKAFRTAAAYRQQAAAKPRAERPAHPDEYNADSSKATPSTVGGDSHREPALAVRAAEPLSAAARSSNGAVDANREAAAPPPRTSPALFAGESGRSLATPPIPPPSARAAHTSAPKAALANAATALASGAVYEGEPVSATNATAIEDAPWQRDARRAATSLEEAARHASGEEAQRLRARWRLAQLVAGDPEAALGEQPGLAPAEQAFWSQQVLGLAALLSTSGVAPDQRLADASAQIQQGALALGEAARLVVRNATFCSAAQGYGIVTRFEKDEFRPGQEVLLYAEVENFQSEATRDGYHTVLQAHYDLFDARGQRIAGEEFGLTEEHCQNRRRDFFVCYRLWLPPATKLPPGAYRLQLTVEDQKSRKLGQASLDFRVSDR